MEMMKTLVMDMMTQNALELLEFVQVVSFGIALWMIRQLWD